MARLQAANEINRNLITLAARETTAKKRLLLALNPPTATTPAQQRLLELNAEWARQQAARHPDDPFTALYSSLSAAECAAFEKEFPEISVELQLQILQQLDPGAQPETTKPAAS